jgi:hypothetical protein
MAELYFGDDPKFFETGPEHLEWSRIGTEAIGMKEANWVLSDDPTDEEAVLAKVLWMPPGYRLFRHAHDCHRFEIVIKGSLDVGNGKTLKAGDVSVSGPGQFYGPHVAGPEGALTLEIFERQVAQYPDLEGEPQGEDAEMLMKAAKAIEEYKGSQAAG